jgi:DNA-binding NarL/FixJ family response regulator
MPTPPYEPTARIRVVVVDADDLVRETVAALLGIGERIEVVGIAGQVAPAIDLVRTASPDVVIVDPRLPDVDDGLAFIREVHAVAPTVRVVIACPQELISQDALAIGPDRCLRKTFRPDDLTAAIVAASESLPA